MSSVPCPIVLIPFKPVRCLAFVFFYKKNKEQERKVRGWGSENESEGRIGVGETYRQRGRG